MDLSVFLIIGKRQFLLIKCAWHFYSAGHMDKFSITHWLEAVPDCRLGQHSRMIIIRFQLSPQSRTAVSH